MPFILKCSASMILLSTSASISLAGGSIEQSALSYTPYLEPAAPLNDMVATRGLLWLEPRVQWAKLFATTWRERDLTLLSFQRHKINLISSQRNSKNYQKSRQESLSKQKWSSTTLSKSRRQKPLRSCIRKNLLASTSASWSTMLRQVAIQGPSWKQVRIPSTRQWL